MVVDAYVETGEPVGSRTLSRRGSLELSPATIRNVMADLEEAGLLFAPHTSAGRLPTEAGLRLFVNGLLEVGRLERGGAAATSTGGSPPPARAWRRRSRRRPPTLSGLSRCAGLVLAPKIERPLEAYRVRAAVADARARRDGDRGRAGREPAHRGADRHAALDPRRGRQLPQFAARRPHRRRGARRDPRRDRQPARAARRADAAPGRGRACLLGRRRRGQRAHRQGPGEAARTT